MFATHFLRKLEQKVKHASAMKPLSDQESIRFQHVPGTLVLVVLSLLHRPIWAYHRGGISQWRGAATRVEALLGTGYRVQGTWCRVQSTEHRVPSTEYRVEST